MNRRRSIIIFFTSIMLVCCSLGTAFSKHITGKGKMENTCMAEFPCDSEENEGENNSKKGVDTEDVLFAAMSRNTNGNTAIVTPLYLRQGSGKLPAERLARPTPPPEHS